MSTLARFQAVLSDTAKPLSAKQLAEKTPCSIPAVYYRINSLRKRGAVIAEVKPRRSETGPTPKRFILIKAVEL